MYHIYDGERCYWCGVNIYDAFLYDETEECYGRVPAEYTSTVEYTGPVGESYDFDYHDL